MKDLISRLFGKKTLEDRVDRVFINGDEAMKFFNKYTDVDVKYNKKEKTYILSHCGFKLTGLTNESLIGIAKYEGLLWVKKDR